MGNKKLISILVLLFHLSALGQVSNIKVGDILTINGVNGIVFQVDDNGEHGTMMSVKAFRSKKNLYSLKSSYLKDLLMNSTSDGKANTQALMDYASGNGINLVNYPLFQWCKSLGTGWYIPSVEQLKSFVDYWLGNNVEEEWEEDTGFVDNEEKSSDADKPHKAKVNEMLLNAGGIPFLNGVLTSTLYKNGKVEMFMYDREKDTWEFVQINPMKADELSVGRAFYDF